VDQPHFVTSHRALAVAGVVGKIDASDLAPERNRWNFALDEEVFPARDLDFNGQVVAGLLCTNVDAGLRARELVLIQGRDSPNRYWDFIRILLAVSTARLLSTYQHILDSLENW
jgi:xanthine dehydrogenase molybdopterin-binding subunit B